MFESMTKLLLESKSNLVITVGLFLGLAFNLRAIYEFLDVFSKRKLTTLRDFSGEKGATGRTKEILQEELNSLLFRYATGINTEKPLRDRIINLHDIADGKLTYLDFKRAFHFLIIKQDGTLGVRKFTLLDQLIHYFNRGLSYLLLFGTAFLLILSILPPPKEFHVQIFLLFFVLFVFASALFILSQTFPLHAAKKIKDEIRKVREQSSIKLLSYTDSKSHKSSKAILSEAEKQAARERFESHFGELALDHPVEANNERIDADLAREYTKNHQE